LAACQAKNEKKMNRTTVVIKKYGNRRLYDTTHSRYINQDEVAEMVQKGHDVQVVDAATGEDLTRLVLTQIIVEHAKEPDSAFPLDILRQMVVASGKAAQENTLKYTKAVLDMYQSAYRAMSPPLNPFEFIQAPTGAHSAVSSAGAPTESAGRAVRSKKDETTEVDELKQRIEELESLVAGIGARRTERKRKGKSRASR
jgi:polyhydroxyalkanoate synthesis repressor PhaR